jgi:hypothetical protein
VHLKKNGLNSLSGQKTGQVGTLPQSHQKLLDQYLHQPRPLHTRRTLDQYHYFSLDDEGITYRDETQTLSLYYIQSSGGSSTHEAGRVHDFPLLMVDQLWLWMLDKSL